MNQLSGKRLFTAVWLAAVVLCGAVMTGSGEVHAASGGRIDAVSYKMNLRLNTKRDSLRETVTIKVKNNTSAPVSELVIRDMTPAIHKYNRVNYSEGNRKRKSRIISVTLKGKKKKLKLTYKKGKTVIRVKLGKSGKIAPGKTRSVVVRMKTDIPRRQDRFGVQDTREGKLYNLSFCFPYLADYANGKWQTDPYFDDGESRSWDLADYDVTFRAPRSYKVAATGSESKKNKVTRIKARKVRDFAIVACNFMKKDTFRADGITVNSYYLKGSRKLGTYRKTVKMVAADSIRLYTDQIGKYPYKELDITPALFGFAFGGMEYPGLVMANASSFFDSAYPDAWSLSDAVAHEIGHQWFYSAVGNREYKEGWLDEGFTTYLERDVYGMTVTDSYKYLRKVDDMFPDIETRRKSRDEIISYARKDYKKLFVNVPPDRYPKDQLYGEAEYEEGYAFLQEVRIKMGDEAFRKFLREYYRTYRLKKASTRDVVRLIRKYDGSKAMDEIIGFYVK